MGQKVCEWSIPDHAIDYCADILGLVDGTQSGRGDLRRRHAVDLDIFSFYIEDVTEG